MGGDNEKESPISKLIDRHCGEVVHGLKRRLERLSHKTYKDEPYRSMLSTARVVRNAEAGDSLAVAMMLARTFPSLYRGTFGRQCEARIVSLLHSLYDAGHLSLADTRVCEVGGSVAGVMILNTGRPIGRGSAAGYWRLLHGKFGRLHAPRVFLGSLIATKMLDRRIPRGSDLVYIEALAVAEEHRGRGLGSLLLADAEAWALDRGRTRLALHVLASNTGARRLYERSGFRPWYDLASKSRWHTPFPNSSWASILRARALKPTAVSQRDC